MGIEWKQTEAGAIFFLDGVQTLEICTPPGAQDFFERDEKGLIRWERRTEKRRIGWHWKRKRCFCRSIP